MSHISASRAQHPPEGVGGGELGQPAVRGAQLLAEHGQHRQRDLRVIAQERTEGGGGDDEQLTGSIALTSAERGSSSTSACSPSIAPGRGRSSTASVPAVVGTVIFTRPSTITSTRSAASPRAISTSPRSTVDPARDGFQRSVIGGVEPLEELHGAADYAAINSE